MIDTLQETNPYTPVESGLSSSEADFPYRALSRGAIVSLIFGTLSIFGLIPTFEFVLVLALLGLLAGVFGLRTVLNYPKEYSGKVLAYIGIGLSSLVLTVGLTTHTYIYLTEVPEGYERVQFFKLQQTNENLPDQPTDVAKSVDGTDIFIKGYIHPASGGGVLRQFILVPDLGTCCFGGQPRSSDMIEVTLKGGNTVKGGMTRRKLAGKFTVNSYPNKLTDFDKPVFYRLKADIAK